MSFFRELLNSIGWFGRRNFEREMEAEFNTAHDLLKNAQQTDDIYAQIDFIDRFLRLADKSRIKDMYDTADAKQIVLEGIDKFVSLGGNMERRQFGYSTGCGNSPAEELEKKLGISRTDVKSFAAKKKNEERKALYDKICESTEKTGWYGPLHDIMILQQYINTEKSHEITDVNVAVFAMNILQKMFFPEQFKARDTLLAGSDQTLHAYDMLGKIIDSCLDLSIQERRIALHNQIDTKIAKIKSRAEKQQDKLYENCEKFARSGDKRYLEEREVYIRISSAYTTLLDEDSSSIHQQVSQLDSIFKSAKRAGHRQSNCQNIS